MNLSNLSYTSWCVNVSVDAICSFMVKEQILVRTLHVDFFDSLQGEPDCAACRRSLLSTLAIKHLTCRRVSHAL